MAIPKTIEEFKDLLKLGEAFEIDPKLMIEWFPKETSVRDLELNRQ
jgi:hypothetical protein